MSANKNDKFIVKTICLTIIIIVSILSITLLILDFNKIEKNKNYNSNVNSSSEVKDDNATIDKISRISDKDRQKAVNQTVKDGMMAVNYKMSVVFYKDTLESKIFKVSNIENNKGDIIFEILDENENVIYTSDPIKTGYECTKISLNKENLKNLNNYTKGEKYNWQINIKYTSGGNFNSLFPLYVIFE